MSFPSLCPGCSIGDHSRHQQGHGIRPGLIGGTYCPCEGDCKPPDMSKWLNGGNESGDGR